jgi:hypothetical protein
MVELLYYTSIHDWFWALLFLPLLLQTNHLSFTLLWAARTLATITAMKVMMIDKTSSPYTCIDFLVAYGHSCFDPDELEAWDVVHAEQAVISSNRHYVGSWARTLRFPVPRRSFRPVLSCSDTSIAESGELSIGLVD